MNTIGSMACTRDMTSKKCLWDIETNPRAVTCFAVSIYGTTVPNCLERFDGKLNNLAARHTIRGNNQTYAAIISLIFRRIRLIINQFLSCSELLEPC